MKKNRSPLLSKCEITIGRLIFFVLTLIFVAARASAHVMACANWDAVSDMANSAGQDLLFVGVSEDFGVFYVWVNDADQSWLSAVESSNGTTCVTGRGPHSTSIKDPNQTLTIEDF